MKPPGFNGSFIEYWSVYATLLLFFYFPISRIFPKGQPDSSGIILSVEVRCRTVRQILSKHSKLPHRQTGDFGQEIIPYKQDFDSFGK